MLDGPTCYLISLKYAPGLCKEFLVLGSHLMQHGWNVQYLLSRRYAWMFSDNTSNVEFVSLSDGVRSMVAETALYPLGIRRRCLASFRAAPPLFLCFYNPHPLNAAIARLAKRFVPRGIRAIYLHEPYTLDKSAYGWKKSAYIHIVELCQKSALAESTDVILPSPTAFDLFNEFFPHYRGKTHFAPILIPDRPGSSSGKRGYFSMIGRINQAKGLDTFVDVANCAAERGEQLEFQIVTASRITEYLKRLVPAAKAKMKIINTQNLSDGEISSRVAESYAVLFLDRQITQSGAMPVAFMNGTPAIARSLPGFVQFVTHGGNGYLLPPEFTNVDVLEAMKSVRDQFDSMSLEARRSFLHTFHEKNWPRYYDWLLTSLESLRCGATGDSWTSGKNKSGPLAHRQT